MNTVFRPKSNLVWATIAFLLDALFVSQFVFYPENSGNIALNLAVAILVAALSYLLWVRPKLILRDVDLVVVNPIQRVVISYSDIQELKTKWTLQIDHAGGSVQVWVAPANGKGRWISESTFRWKNSRVPVTETKTNDITSISQSTRSDSGLAASLIRQRIDQLH